MKFNDTTAKSGIIQACETYLGMEDGCISGDAILLKQFTMLVNGYYRRVNSWIWEATGVWEYDDSNYTDLPIATTTIVNDQQDYELPSTAQKVDRVEILDINGDYKLLKPLDKSQIKESALSEFLETPGLPIYYDLIGRSVFLYPKPDTAKVTADLGLKIYFTRDVDEFVSGDTDTEPGFVNNFHSILPLGASLDYVLGYMPEETSKMNNFRIQLKNLKDELKKFYSSRHREIKARIDPKRRNYT